MKSHFKRLPDIHLKFQISLLVLILFILVLSTATTITAVLSINRNVSRQKAEQLFNETGLSIRMMLNTQLDKAIELADLMTAFPDFTEAASEFGLDYPGLPFFFKSLEHNSFVYSIYTGFSDGSFIQLIQTSGNPMILKAHNAPEETAYILRSISGIGNNRNEYWSFLDNSRNLLSSRKNPNPALVPAERPWYSEAEMNTGTILTEPYIFNSLEKPGITAASAISESAVSGVDITLSELELFLNNIDISDGTGVMILDNSDRVLAANSQMKAWLGRENIGLRDLDSFDPVKKSFLLQQPTDDKDITGPYKEQVYY